MDGWMDGLVEVWVDGWGWMDRITVGLFVGKCDR